MSGLWSYLNPNTPQYSQQTGFIFEIRQLLSNCSLKRAKMLQTSSHNMKFVLYCAVLLAVLVFNSVTEANLASDPRTMILPEFHKLLRTRREPSPATHTVPRYMIRKYEQLNHDLHAGTCSHLNTVRNLRNLGSDRSCHHVLLKFNLSTIPDAENILAARLHLELDENVMQKKGLQQRRLRFRLHYVRSGMSNSATELRQQDSKSWEKGRLIHSRSVSLGSVKEVLFDVTQMAVNTHDKPASAMMELLLLVDSDLSPSACSWVGEFAAMLEVESDASVSLPCDPLRRKRSPGDNNSEIPSSARVVSSGRDSCQRQPLPIRFQDIGWGDWIVAPAAYDAYVCAGGCPFPINDHLNASNHAVVQNLLHTLKPQHVPAACCVPTKLSPMSMLYFDVTDNLVLRVYEDMVVDACGCQ